MRVELISIGVRARHVLHGKSLQLEEGLDDGRRGNFVDEAAEDLVRSGDEELTELDSLHQFVLVSPGGEAYHVSDGAVGC